MASENNNIPTLAVSECECGLSSIDVNVNCNNTYNLATRGYVWAVVSSVSGNFGTVRSINGVLPDENNNVSLPSISSLDYSGDLNQINADLSVTIGGVSGHRLLTDIDFGTSFIGDFEDWGEVKASTETLSTATSGNFIIVDNASDYTSERYMTEVNVEYTEAGDIVEHLYVGQILYYDITLPSTGTVLPKGHTLTLDDVKAIGEDMIETLPLYTRHYGKWYLTYSAVGVYDVENWRWVYQINDDYRQDVKIAVNAAENAANLADLIDSENPAKRTYGSGDGKVTVDLALDETSDNPIANSAVTKAVKNRYTKFEVNEKLSEKQDTLTFDLIPLKGSMNPVRSGGIYSAIDNIGTSKIDRVKPAVKGNIPQLTESGMLVDSGKTFDDCQKATESLTYSELKAKRDAGELKPGASYRITDYVAMTNGNGGSVGAGHRFDIIVVADSTYELNEDARASVHDGDLPDDTVDGDIRTKYFDGNRLTAWKVLYCLDNDTTRFGWANADCRGIVYRLIDEFGNDCPYDFKGLKFSSPKDGTLRYTFDSGDDPSENVDLSNDGFVNLVHGNRIGRYVSQNAVQELNCIVMNGRGCRGNTFSDDCRRMAIGAGSGYNTFSDGCYGNTIGDSCSRNTFGGGCRGNTIGNGCADNTFGDGCVDNSVGASCSCNTFGGSFYGNSVGDRCFGNVFGSNCSENTLGSYCMNNSFGCDCYGNLFGSYYCGNILGDLCHSILFKNGPNGKDYVSYVTVESGNGYITFDLRGESSASEPYRNVTVTHGVNDVSTEIVKTIRDDTDGGQTFSTVFRPVDSQEISI